VQGRGLGDTTLTVQAPGYSSTASAVTVQPSGFVFYYCILHHLRLHDHELLAATPADVASACSIRTLAFAASRRCGAD
jgi:hypothetical protein